MTSVSNPLFNQNSHDRRDLPGAIDLDDKSGAMTAVFFRDEPVRLDPDALQILIERLGEQGANDVVCRAMEELAIRLSDLPALFRAGHLTELGRLAHSLIGISKQVGLTSLARVAGDVVECTRRGDTVALAATLARLERTGEQSLSTIWDLRDRSV